MIYLYSGTPGSGKSLHMASDIYWWIKTGGSCICNFEINLDKIKGNKSRFGEFYYIPNDIIRPDLLITYSKLYFKSHKFKEGRIRLYLDECQIMFNAREWASAGRKEWLSFFTQHRKYGYDVYLVAQFDRMIDRQIRSLIEYEVIHRKVKNFGKFGFLYNLVAGGSLFVAVKMWYPLKERVGSEFFKGHQRYFELYNTLDTFN